MTKNKIVIWESHSTLEGGQKVSLNILDALKDKYQCAFFVPEEGPLTIEIKKRGIPYKIIPSGSYNDGKKGIKDIAKLLYRFPKVFISAYQYLKKNNIDLIYSNGSRTFIWSSIIGKVLSVPVIWHVHNFFEDKKTRSVLNFLGRLNNVKKLIFVSSAVKGQFPFLGRKSEVIYNGFNIPEDMNTSSDIDIRREFGISPSARIISTISWISRPKNTGIFIRSIPYILEQCNNIHFLIVGGIKEGHKKYYDHLLDLADKTGTRDHITFTGHCSNVPELLRDVCINCVTSLEACPLVIPEAYFAGVPVIGPDIGGTPELIKDSETGLLYKFNDEKDLAEKALTLLKDKDLHQTVSKNCKDYVAEFDPSKFTAHIKRTVEQSLI